VSNDIVTDQRVLKIANEIILSGAKVTILGRELPWSLEADIPGIKIVRYKMLFRKGLFFYKFLNIRLFFSILSRKPDILVANDLDTLLPNYIISRFRRIPLVYDAHEYFTGTPELMERPLRRFVWKSIERLTVPRIKHMMTVNRSIAGIYGNEYGIEVSVVRNFSKRWKGEVSSRIELGIDRDDLLCVIQGTGINRDRGGIQLIEAIQDLTGVHLLVIGRGDRVAEMRDRVLELGLVDRVTFLPVMKWEDMMSYTAMADVGLSLDSPGSPNYENSLPNKIFDYMSAGLAIIATDLKEVARVIRDSGCGLVINEPSPGEISRAISRLRDNRMLLEQCRKNSVKSHEEYCWEGEKKEIRRIYSGAGLLSWPGETNN
ncbi:MAG: glycosyltransferase, partial [Bacteroidales bacterium]